MYEQVMENLRKATESSIQLQQEMMQKWSHLFPAGGGAAATVPAAALDSFAKFQKRWEEALTDALQRQREMVDAHYKAGLKAIEDMFQVGEARTPQEYQEKVVELYRRNFESLRALSESQLREFKAAAEKWAQLTTKGT